MPKLGDVVLIKSKNKYPKLYKMLGYINYSTNNFNRSSFGICIPGVINHKSSLGLFWISNTDFEIIKDSSKEVSIKELQNIQTQEEIQKKIFGFFNEPQNEEIPEVNIMSNEKVVTYYFNKKKQEILKLNAEKVASIISDDSNVVNMSSAVLNILKQGGKVTNEEHAYNLANSSNTWFSFVLEETTKKLQDCDKEYDNLLNELAETKNRVLDLLEGCSSYDQEINILLGYGIINKLENGGIVMC